MSNTQINEHARFKLANNSVFIGIMKGLPVFVGYLPIGFAYGVLAMQAGFTAIETVLMSIMVYAGSAQFIGVGMVAAATGITTIILTTFLVNLRHLLMSASLAQRLSGKDKRKLALFSYLITDESFAVNSVWLRNNNDVAFRSLFSVNVTAYLGWISGSILGALVGAQPINVEKYGLDYALPAMFIILLIFQLENRKYIVLAIIAGVLSTLLSQVLSHNLHIIITTVLISALGVVISRWKPAVR
jgi:4-azaleucine resistance transporter AzlC